jgi:hypothetical protein
MNDKNFLFSGMMSPGFNLWQMDSPGSISAYVDLTHMKFDRVPKYFSSIVATSQRSKRGHSNSTISSMYNDSALREVVGKHQILEADNDGFRIRLRYKNESKGEEMLNPIVARLDGWRVRWVAISEGHSLVEAARSDVVNDKYEHGIDEKPVGQSLLYVKMLEALAKESPLVVQAIMGQTYELPRSKRPKIKKRKQKTNETGKGEKKSTNATPVDDSDGESNAQKAEAPSASENAATTPPVDGTENQDSETLTDESA